MKSYIKESSSLIEWKKIQNQAIVQLLDNLTNSKIHGIIHIQPKLLVAHGQNFRQIIQLRINYQFGEPKIH